MHSDESPFGAGAEIGIGLSDVALVIISVAGFCFLGVTVFSIIMLRLKTREELEKEEETSSADYEARLVRSDVANLSRAERRARARAIMKQKRRVQPRQHRHPPGNEGGDDAAPGADGQGEENENNNNNNPQHAIVPAAAEAADDDIDLGEDGVDPSIARMSRKERQKRAKALEKEERKLHGEERRKQQQEMEKAAQKEKLERQKLKAKELEKERRQLKLEQEQAERQRLVEFRNFLSSDARTLLVDDWIQELQTKERTVSLSELAASFDVPTERVERRIRELLDQKRVAGVITENRGYFVYVSEQELEMIANRVRDKQVASHPEVTAICNSVVFESG